ncbi:uncharacterized protein [Polyergus mexicanus]|uniref:uncharacterized protein n=1 Tax=Polyergus mexicanus TaxID=615972 RepID=UPI0038B44A22
MDYKVFIIAEFNDGLQLISALWYNADKKSCIWPSHFKSKFRINKAIITGEMLQNNSEWDELAIKRIFSKAGTYEEGMGKLVLAKDTSNIDMSSDELREQTKKERRMKAKKIISSSSDEDLCLNKDENNYVRSNKILPDYSQIGNFISSNKLQFNQSVHNNSTSTLCKKTYTLSSNEYKKLVLGKLNKVLYKLNTIENKFNIFEQKMQPSNCLNQKNDIQLPISTFQELIDFEEQLHEMEFKQQVLNMFKLVGGHIEHVMIRNILKKALTNTFAQNFSSAGKKGKKSFQNLSLSQIIIQALRKTYEHMTDNENPFQSGLLKLL